MGKKGSGSSWLTAVKREFRSPTKDSDKRSQRRKEDYDQEEYEEKLKHDAAAAATTNASVVVASRTDQDQKHALAMVVATAQAAVEVARWTLPFTSICNQKVGFDKVIDYSM
ncbi:hypothetical protein RIF29_24843 [Crotalaria pallida]|uniref:Uncharacterized protein n=1 Tax=Crotalaria pallida TaxID=3830 RepID=A0AAN9EL27_CROPI